MSQTWKLLRSSLSSEDADSQDQKNNGSGSAEKLLPSSLKDLQEPQYLRGKKSNSMRRFWIWTICISNIILLIFSLSILAHQISGKANNHHWLLKKTSSFCMSWSYEWFLISQLTDQIAAPVLERLDIATFVKQTDGSLFESLHPSPYRNARKPDPAVNKAWEAVDTIRTFPITASDIRKLGKDPSLSVKFPSEFGLGEEAYVAQIDVFHQIHCLNLLRNLAWAEYGRTSDDGKKQKPPSELHWIHVSHCTDLLMQNIMCQGSLDVLTFNWMETQELPFPDFFVNRQCRDFDAIVQWQEENTLPLDVGRNLSRPEGAKQIPAPKAYYDMFGKSKVEIHEMT